MKIDLLISGILCTGVLAGVGLLVHRRWSRPPREREVEAGFDRHLAAHEAAAREQLASEMQDSLGHQLVLLRNGALTALAQPGSSPAVQAELTQISSLAASALDEARAIAEHLRPVELERLGFAQAVEELLARQLAQSGIQVFKEVDNLGGAVSAPAVLYLYRLVETLIRTASEQVGVKTVLFEVKLEQDRIRLRLEHVGQRSDLGAAAAPGTEADGLSGLAQQVRVVGGKFRSSVTETGACWQILIPREQSLRG